VNAIARRATRAADVPKPLARSRTWTASVTTSSRPTCSRPSGRRRRRRHRAAAAWLVAALVRMASRDRCSPSLTDRLPDLRGFGWADARRRGYSTGELLRTRSRGSTPSNSNACGSLAMSSAAGSASISLCVGPPPFAAIWLSTRCTLTGARGTSPPCLRQWWTVFVETPLLGRTVLRRRPGLTRLLCGSATRCPRRRQRSRRSGTIQSAGSV
jgi:hypothetical protein